MCGMLAFRFLADFQVETLNKYLDRDIKLRI